MSGTRCQVSIKTAPDPRDITVLVAFNGQTPGLDTEVYVIPTARLVEDINRCYRHWLSFKKRDGSERKRTNHRGLSLNGEKRPSNIANGFRNEWRDFRDGWGLLDGSG